MIMKIWISLCLLLLSLQSTAQSQDSLSIETLTDSVYIKVKDLHEQVQTLAHYIDEDSLHVMAENIQSESQAISQLIKDNISYQEEDQGMFSTYFVLALSDPDMFSFYYVNAMSHLGTTASYPMGKVLNTLKHIDKTAQKITQSQKPRKLQRLQRDMERSTQKLVTILASKD